MENKNNGGKRWSPNEKPGNIIDSIIEARKPMRVSDPRYDIIIDIGLLLQGQERVVFETDHIELTRSEAPVYILYSVKVDDGLVFDVMFTADGMVFGEYIDGFWRAVLSQFVKQQRRKLLAGVA
jgi:hypothetical protein